MTKRTRKAPETRKEDLLAAGCRAAKCLNYANVRFQHIADEAKVSRPLVVHYFKTLPQLQRDLMRYAVRNNVAEVIAQGLLVGDAHAKKATPEQREAAIAVLAAD